MRTMRLKTVVRDAARRRWHAHLDKPDRVDARGNASAYPFLNTVMVDFLDRDPALAVDRRYVFGAVHGAYLASRLGIDRVSFLEFGTGRGGGVDKLERLADLVWQEFGVQAAVRTFDIGTGVPPAASLADLPQQNPPGSYSDFDADATRARFRRPDTELLLGRFDDSVPAYIGRDDAPVAFVSFDTGVHSATSQALRIVRDASPERLLPRVVCFFEPILAYTYAWFNGDWRAIGEHNEQERDDGELGWRRPLAPILGLHYYAPRRLCHDPWVEKYFLAHVTDHPLYTAPDGLLRTPLSAVTSTLTPAR
jgi:hypothetical protein